MPHSALVDRGTMTSRQRVRRALRHQEPDRVPLNYSANPDIDRRLKTHFGLAADDGEGLLKALGVDFRPVGPRYTGKPLHRPIPDRQVDPLWGARRRWVEHSTGGYWDYCDFPLADADADTIVNWPMPTPDDFDCDIFGRCGQIGDWCVCFGSPGLGYNINTFGFIRGVEQTLLDLADEYEPSLHLLDRRVALWVEVTRRCLIAADRRVDLLWIGEDLGSQRGPLISREMFRRLIRPRLECFTRLGREFGISVMIHSCGSSSWAFDDFLEMGISVVDTLQPEAAEMAPAHLKQTWGDRLAFHGCISTAGPVAGGTVEETVSVVRQTLDTMMPGGGYCCAPTHALQDNSPTENVVAMYETAHRHGLYG